MQLKIIITTLLLLIFVKGFSQEDSIILEIRSNFQKWQPIIEKEFKSCDKYYNYAWGDNYQFNKWLETRNDSLILEKEVSIIQKEKLGYFVSIENFSFSGDWFVAADYYFNTEGQLYFIFWRMNTFNAEEPSTIEKRLYFDNNGKIIRNLKSVYKINTKEKIDSYYMDREIDYKLMIKEMDFYKNLKIEK